MYKHFEKDPKGEEKKLTDEEIVKALKCCTVDELTDCENCPLLRESCAIIRKYALDLIHRLQNEVSQWKSKAEHIEEVYNADREHFIKTTTEQKAEIERLTEENEYLDMVAKQALTDYQNTQVQVDELTEKLGKVLSGIKADELLVAKGMEQTVKDTAKEILPEMLARAKRLKEQFDSTTYGTNREHLIATIEIEIEGIKNLAKRYGVEVE